MGMRHSTPHDPCSGCRGWSRATPLTVGGCGPEERRGYGSSSSTGNLRLHHAADVVDLGVKTRDHVVPALSPIRILTRRLPLEIEETFVEMIEKDLGIRRRM